MASHRVDVVACQRLLRNPAGGVARDMMIRGRRVQYAQSRLVGRTSGALARDVHAQPLAGRWQPGVEVGSDLPQALHHLRGHGVIRPVRAKALRFKPKGGSGVIFRMRVGPVAPNPWLQRSLRAARR